jgi:hypothetical protein
MSEWNYRIEPFCPSPDKEGIWTRAAEAEAVAWFGFRERGEDKRVFGVFPTRGDAEKAMRLLQGHERPRQVPRRSESGFARAGSGAGTKPVEGAVKKQSPANNGL